MQELDLLGDLLVEAIKFLDSGYDVSLTLHDETTQSDVVAGEMFEKIGERWFLRQESLPGEISIKAVGIDKDGIYIETAPLDVPRAKELLAEEVLPFSFDEKQRLFANVHTGKAVITFSEPTKPQKELKSRMLFTIPLTGTSVKLRSVAIGFIDTLYSRGCFSVEEEDSDNTSAAGTGSMKMVLDMELQVRLQLEQRPLLALQGNVGAIMRPELSLASIGIDDA